MDITIITALDWIAESQAAPNEKKLSHCNQWLDYLGWNLQAAIEYKASGMQLWVHGYTA